MNNINNNVIKIIFNNYFFNIFPPKYVNIMNKYFKFNKYSDKISNELENILVRIHNEYVNEFWLIPLKKLDLGIVDISISNSNYGSYDYYGFTIELIVKDNFHKLFNYRFNEVLYKNKEELTYIYGNTFPLTLQNNHCNLYYNDYGSFIVLDIDNYKIEFIAYLLKNKIVDINNNYEKFLINSINNNKFLLSLQK